jgi:hypothetical protein
MFSLSSLSILSILLLAAIARPTGYPTAQEVINDNAFEEAEII